MMDIFDLEQEIMKAWNVVDDMKDAIQSCRNTSALTADDRDNLILGMAALYQMRFERLWECFEDVAKEYHSRAQCSRCGGINRHSEECDIE